MIFFLMLRALIISIVVTFQKKRKGAKPKDKNRYEKPRVLVENGRKDLNMLVLNGSNAADLLAADTLIPDCGVDPFALQ